VQGVTGGQGVTGVQGVQGVQGAVGVQGTQGVQGIQGRQGSTGTQGALGTQGTTGAQGIQGITGTQGVTGAGTQGATGTGSQGTTGTQGNTGGAQGTQGTTGTGTQGATGTQGVTGTQGAGNFANTINATNNTSSSALYPVMVGASGSNQLANVTTGGLAFNASTNFLSVAGNITGANIGGNSLLATPGNAYFKSSGTDNFTISTYTNTPNPNFNINIGNGAGGIDRNPIFWNVGLSFSGNGRADTGTPDVKIDSAGNISAVGTIIVNSRGNATAIVNGAGNAVGNIGSSSTYFNKLFAQATTALYADLAENYRADADYAPGTVVVFGGTQEITVSDQSHDTRVAGVVSTNPAHLMNSGMGGEHAVTVALTGRVPCWVQGPVAKGDRLVNISAGTAGRLDDDLAQIGCMVGKSLEDITTTQRLLIEVSVGRT
jgi:hypothetical protein